MSDVTPPPTPEDETHALAEFLRGQLRVYRLVHSSAAHIEVLALLAVAMGIISDRERDGEVPL